ncbi:MAG TPA: FAD-dependent oxidoreductase, partial [Nocardioides sp.]
MERWDTVVVGAGVAGLVAARDLVAAGHEVLVLEGSATIGGKLRLARVGGVAVDVGAEAMLARRPEGLDLAAELGLDVVHPTRAASQVWSRGALRRLPRTLMGVPLDLDDLAESCVLSPEGLARAGVER